MYTHTVCAYTHIDYYRQRERGILAHSVLASLTAGREVEAKFLVTGNL